MDSKVVNREIRGRIWPLLKEVGFGSVTTRSAWRHHDDRVDVVNFQSFNKYNAEVMGVTTFSFAVNLGCYLRYIPPQWPPKKVKDGLPFPQEYECQFRGGLAPTASELSKDSSIWVVKPDGRNLAWCISDVAQQIPVLLAWFERLGDRKEVLRILTQDDQEMSDLWGFGSKPSPNRSYLTGYVALAVGDEQLAEKELENAVASGCYTHLFSSVEGARYRAV